MRWNYFITPEPAINNSSHRHKTSQNHHMMECDIQIMSGDATFCHNS